MRRGRNGPYKIELVLCPIPLAYLDSFVSLLFVGCLVVRGDEAVFVIVQQDLVQLCVSTARVVTTFQKLKTFSGWGTGRVAKFTRRLQ